MIRSRKGSRKSRYDKSLYTLRNEIERFFDRRKQCRRIASRYDKIDFGFLTFAAALLHYS